jgi:hypothetical protein
VSTISLSPSLSGTYSQVQPAANLARTGREHGGAFHERARGICRAARAAN